MLCSQSHVFCPSMIRKAALELEEICLWEYKTAVERMYYLSYLSYQALPGCCKHSFLPVSNIFFPSIYLFICKIYVFIILLELFMKCVSQDCYWVIPSIIKKNDRLVHGMGNVLHESDCQDILGCSSASSRDLWVLSLPIIGWSKSIATID